MRTELEREGARGALCPSLPRIGRHVPMPEAQVLTGLHVDPTRESHDLEVSDGEVSGVMGGAVDAEAEGTLATEGEALHVEPARVGAEGDRGARGAAEVKPRRPATRLPPPPP